MTNKEIASTVDRYLFATIGMFLSAVGIAMTIVSNIGTAPLSCPSYVMNLRFPAVMIFDLFMSEGFIFTISAATFMTIDACCRSAAAP